MSDEERRVIIEALKAITCALMICETEARFALNCRIDEICEAIDKLKDDAK